MSCENKLTNLVFKNKENSTRTQCASFFLPLYIYIYIEYKKTPRMKCNATPRDKRKKIHKNQRTKNNGHKGKNNEAQGPC